MSSKPIIWDGLHRSEAHELYWDEVPAGESVKVEYPHHFERREGPGFHWAIIKSGHKEIGPDDPQGFEHDREEAAAAAYRSWLRLIRPQTCSAWDIPRMLPQETVDRVHREAMCE